MTSLPSLFLAVLAAGLCGCSDPPAVQTEVPSAPEPPATTGEAATEEAATDDATTDEVAVAVDNPPAEADADAAPPAQVLVSQPTQRLARATSLEGMEAAAAAGFEEPRLEASVDYRRHSYVLFTVAGQGPGSEVLTRVAIPQVFGVEKVI